MKITVLTENAVGRSHNRLALAEWGLSLFLEIEGKRILFDTGHKGTFIQNAKEIGINIDEADFVVLSHHHWDHTGGLRFHKFAGKKKIVIHPRVLEKLPSEEAKNLTENFEIISTDKPLEFSPDIYFLGEIPRETSFEKGTYENDPMEDDTALAIKTDKGLVIVTGCSHAGICNITEYAKKVTGEKVYALIGGFHLFDNDKEAIEGTVDYFKKENPSHLFPMHCVDTAAMSQFHQNFLTKKHGTGDSFDL